MVASSFPWFRQSSRDNPDPRVALRVDDGKQVVLDHPEQDIAILAVIATPVLTHHGEEVIEGPAGCLETYAVPGQISGSLLVVPLES
jgi:spermidine synthase